VPTSAELGLPGFLQIGWNGYVVPKGTPPEIVARLQKEISAILRGKDFSEWMASLGSEAVGSTSAEFAAFIKEDCPRWQKVVKDAGIRLE
jgi:tripartite-type tricarboxylate transporter receptor subunit TctC